MWPQSEDRSAQTPCNYFVGPHLRLRRRVFARITSRFSDLPLLDSVRILFVERAGFDVHERGCGKLPSPDMAGEKFSRREIVLASWSENAHFRASSGLQDDTDMLLLIDNYDSFTWNLVHYFGELGEDVVVKRNDELDAAAAMAMRPDAIVLSPGPCDPDRAGICLDLIRAADGNVPILGVCLGHQAIGQAFGGHIVRAPEPMHGKLSRIRHTGRGVFRGIENGFEATRYHSLVIEPSTLPDCLEVTATTDDGVIMGVQHHSCPLHGVQFHPESIASQHGHALLRNFLELARQRVSA